MGRLGVTFLTKIGLANKAVVILVTLVVLGAGLFSMVALRQEMFPSMTNPQAVVIASYPGASPTSVEKEVTLPLETAVNQVAGVTEVTSTSATNLSQITVMWDFNTDSQKIVNELRSAVEGTRADMPEGVEPQLMEFQMDDMPVVVLAVSSDKPTADLARDLENVALPKFKDVPGVQDATITGQEVREVVITERPADVDRLNVDMSQLQQLIPTYKAPMPAGALNENNENRNVQVGIALDSVDKVRNLQLQGKDGPVALSAVADVEDRPKETNAVSRVNGEAALTVSVMKTQEGNTVEVSNGVKEAITEVEKEIGSGVTFRTVFNQAPYIEQSVHDLAVEGGLGLLMAVLVILAFLRSFKATVITAVSIPLSLLIALLAVWAWDYTLNLLTLSALTVSVGRVVDDSIVVIENIERHRDLGERFDSRLIVGAVREVAGAVTASTLTTAAVFLPLGLVTGMVGQIFRPFALTVIVALLGSLIVSLTVVPVLGAWFLRPRTKPLPPAKQAKLDARAAKRDEASRVRGEAERARAMARAEQDYAKATARYEKKENSYRELLAGRGYDQAATAAAMTAFRQDNPPPEPPSAPSQAAHLKHETAETALQRWYLPALRWSLHHPVITLVAAGLIFILSIAMTPLLKTSFLEDSGQTSLSIQSELPPGTDLATSDAAARKIEGVLAAESEVETYSTTIGGDPSDIMSGGASANTVSMSVTLKADADGEKVTGKLERDIAKLKGIGEAKIINNMTGGGSQDLEVKVQGTEEQTLAQGAAQVQEMMEGLKDTDQVTSDLAEQETILQVDINEPVAARFGMSQANIGPAVATAVDGTQLGTMTIDDVSRDLYLRTNSPVTTKAELERLQLPVTEKQTADAQKAASDKMQEEAEAKAEAELAKSLRDLDDQQAELRKNRNEMVRQMNQMRAAGSAGASMAGGADLAAPGAPGMPGAPGGAPGAGMDPAAGAAQMQQGLDQMQQQIDALDEQIAAMDEQRQQAREQADEAKKSQQQQEDIQNMEGTPIRLSQVANVNEVKSPATITRIDGTRSVTVSAKPTGDNLTATTAAIQRGLQGLDLPDGVTATIGGASEQQSESFGQMFLAMAVAIALVYIIMVATFRSLLQPLMLLVSIPVAATGAFLLLVVTQTSLGLPAMIGLLMLIGIVVTNAIVLIDLVNQFRQGGASIDDSVIHGSRLRLRPIIMTALATIMALVPMSLGLTGGGVFISRPLAVVVIGGLISSTALTLILVPVLFHLMERVRTNVSKRKERPTGPAADEDPGVDELDRLMKPGPEGSPA